MDIRYTVTSFHGKLHAGPSGEMLPRRQRSAINGRDLTLPERGHRGDILGAVWRGTWDEAILARLFAGSLSEEAEYCTVACSCNIMSDLRQTDGGSQEACSTSCSADCQAIGTLRKAVASRYSEFTSTATASRPASPDIFHIRYPVSHCCRFWRKHFPFRIDLALKQVFFKFYKEIENKKCN